MFIFQTDNERRWKDGIFLCFIFPQPSETKRLLRYGAGRSPYFDLSSSNFNNSILHTQQDGREREMFSCRARGERKSRESWWASFSFRESFPREMTSFLGLPHIFMMVFLYLRGSNHRRIKITWRHPNEHLLLILASASAAIWRHTWMMVDEWFTQ